MAYYVFVEKGKINGCGQALDLDFNVLNVEVTKDVFDNIEKYIYENGDIILNPNYETEQAEIERARLDALSLTAADVERAVYKVTGMDFDDILELVENRPEASSIDLKALKIELKANNFYRGNPYISQIGALLGFSEKQLDEFFESGNPAVLS